MRAVTLTKILAKLFCRSNVVRCKTIVDAERKSDSGDSGGGTCAAAALAAAAAWILLGETQSAWVCLACVSCRRVEQMQQLQLPQQRLQATVRLQALSFVWKLVLL